MKRIALFAAALLLGAGVAFAQQPAKKSQAVDKAKAVKLEAGAAEVNQQKQGCGNCPKQGQCCNAQNVKSENAQAKPACNKGTATENKATANAKSANANVKK